MIERDHESTIRLSKTCQLVGSGSSVVWTSLNEYDDTAFQRRHRFSAAGKFVDNETDYYVLARLTIIINRFTFSATRLTRRLELSRAAWPRFLFAPFDPQSRSTFLIKRDPPINSRVTVMNARGSHWSRILPIFSICNGLYLFYEFLYPFIFISVSTMFESNWVIWLRTIFKLPIFTSRLHI